MLQNIANLEGVTVLSKQQQQSVNGGEKCKTISSNPNLAFENDGPGTGTYNGGATAGTCVIQCRPSFIGIGFGSWGPETSVPC